MNLICDILYRQITFTEHQYKKGHRLQIKLIRTTNSGEQKVISMTRLFQFLEYLYFYGRKSLTSLILSLQNQCRAIVWRPDQLILL